MSIHLSNGTIDIHISGIDSESDFVTVHPIDGWTEPSDAGEADGHHTYVAAPVEADKQFDLDFELLDQL